MPQDGKGYVANLPLCGSVGTTSNFLTQSEASGTHPDGSSYVAYLPRQGPFMFCQPLRSPIVWDGKGDAPNVGHR